MKFLAILLLFAFVGKIASASAPRVVYRMDDDSAESDETDVEADDEPLGDSSEEVPEWSFRKIPEQDSNRWNQQAGQGHWQQGHQGQGQFQEQNRIQGSFHGQGQGQQGASWNNPTRRFRDDDSDEEDEEDEEDGFNDDVVNSDISYSPPSSVGGGSAGGFRSIAISGRGRATPTGTRMTMTRRPVTSSLYPAPSRAVMNNIMRHPAMQMSAYNRMPMYERVQVSNRAQTQRQRPSGQRQQQGNGNWVAFDPYQNQGVRQPVRRVTSVVNRGQYQNQYQNRRPGMTSSYHPGSSMMYNRPMVYDRYHMMPYRQPGTYGQYYGRHQMTDRYNQFMERI